MDAPLAADGEDRHDIGVVQPGDGLGLALEPLHRLLVGHDAEPQDLQGHAAAERGLLGLVDDAHAAAAELADDPELAQGGRRPRPRGPVARWTNSMPARQASSCAASSGWAASSCVAIRGLAGLEVGQVAVQDADDRRG